MKKKYEKKYSLVKAGVLHNLCFGYGIIFMMTCVLGMGFLFIGSLFSPDNFTVPVCFNVINEIWIEAPLIILGIPCSIYAFHVVCQRRHYEIKQQKGSILSNGERIPIVSTLLGGVFFEGK